MIFLVPIQALQWYRFLRYSGTGSSAMMVPIRALRWYRLTDTIMNAHDLLIIDDFGMVKLDGQIQHDFEQIIDDRYNRKALILASQLPVTDWYDVFQSELIAEACLDRIVHKAIKFTLSGESLRKKY